MIDPLDAKVARVIEAMRAGATLHRERPPKWRLSTVAEIDSEIAHAVVLDLKVVSENDELTFRYSELFPPELDRLNQLMDWACQELERAKSLSTHPAKKETDR